MAKNFDVSGDISQDTGSVVGSKTGTDFGGDLANDNGVDLNAPEGQKEILAKSDADNLSMSKDRSWGERLGAGMSALGALASPIYSQYAQMEDMNGHDAPVDYAIFQEYSNPNQQIDVDLAQFAQLQELENREQSREASELNSALDDPNEEKS